MTGFVAVMVQRVLIIGGGFTGSAIAYHLGEVLQSEAEIIVVEPREALGAGLAYGTPTIEHRINVPAARMSLSTRDPLDFAKWLQEQGHALIDADAVEDNGDVFPSRFVFGDYVRDRLAPLEKRGSVRHVRSRVVTADRHGGTWSAKTEHGETLTADVLVLAVTHAAPATPPSLRCAVDQSNERSVFIQNPWQAGVFGRIKPLDRVLIVGSGLTMADIVASLNAQGHTGEIVAISRRGQRSQGHAAVAATNEALAIAPQPTARLLVKAVRAALAEDRQRPWQVVFDALRRQGTTLWQALPLEERRRLLRHLRPFWDTRRFRIAPQVDRVLEARLATGALTIHAASVVGADATEEGWQVTLRLRNGNTRQERVSAIILATGPDHRGVVESNPLLSYLRDNGAVEVDPLHLGIHVDRLSRPVVGSTVTPALYVGGPLARATFGELMGLPEVTAQAEAVARAIMRDLLRAADNAAAEHEVQT